MRSGDGLDAIGRGEDPDYLEYSGGQVGRGGQSGFPEPPDHRGGGGTWTSDGSGTPGLPLGYSSRPTHFPMCLLCFLGLCEHKDHKEGGQVHVWAVSIMLGDPLCGDCLQASHNRMKGLVQKRLGL
jgi:hypothetical protein